MNNALSFQIIIALNNENTPPYFIHSLKTLYLNVNESLTYLIPPYLDREKDIVKMTIDFKKVNFAHLDYNILHFWPTKGGHFKIGITLTDNNSNGFLSSVYSLKIIVRTPLYNFTHDSQNS